MTTELVKGFRDISGKDAVKNEQIRKIVVETFKKYSFEPAETPVIEYEEFVKSGNQGDEAVSDIFKLKDKGNRKLALRYEFTFQLKRLAKNKKLPYKRYQIGQVFRDEPISTNRFRQFTQCDVDVIGSNVKDDAEVLAVVKNIFDNLRIKAVIYINNRKLLNEILEEQNIKNKQAVMREIDKLDKLSEAEVRKNLKKYNAEKVLSIFKKPKNYFKKFNSYSEIKELEEFCKIYNIKIIFQPSLARGLSYYNRNIFEIKAKNMKESIAGGGSYEINSIPSTGISFSIERLAGLAKIKDEKKSVLIISIKQDKDAIKLAERLRKAGVSCSILFGKVSKSLEYANSYDINKVIFVGDKEVKTKKYKLKDMLSGKEQKLNIKEMIKKLSY